MANKKLTNLPSMSNKALFSGNYPTNKKPSIVEMLQYLSDSGSTEEDVYAAYGGMLRKKFAMGGDVGFDETTGVAPAQIDWESYLNTPSDDLMANFTSQQGIDLFGAGTKVAASAIDNLEDPDKTRFTGKEVDRATASSALKGAGQGASAGAKLGSMIIPGVGTAIGGAVGAVGGAVIGGVTGNNKAKDEQLKTHDAMLKQYYGADGGILPGIEDPLQIASGAAGKATVGGDTIGEEGIGNFNLKSAWNIKNDLNTLGKAQSELEGVDFDRTSLMDIYRRSKRGTVPSFAEGGDYNKDLDELNGPTHDQGGIQLTPNAEVEGGEVKWDTYIFSDQLTSPETGKTFAAEAKKIKAKFEERNGDGPTERAKEAALTKLMQANEAVKIEKQAAEKEQVQQAQVQEMQGQIPTMMAEGGELYPDGGETAGPGDKEKVVKGSERDLEIQALLEKRKLYDEQQAYLTSTGLTPTALSVEEFSKKYPTLDPSVAPEGSTFYGYGNVDPSTIPAENALKGHVPFTYKGTNNSGQGDQFLTGIADPGNVPEWEYQMSEEEIKQAADKSAYDKYVADEGITGFILDRYSDPDTKEWKTDYKPTKEKGAADIYTQGNFKPVDQVSPNDYKGWQPIPEKKNAAGGYLRDGGDLPEGFPLQTGGPTVDSTLAPLSITDLFNQFKTDPAVENKSVGPTNELITKLPTTSMPQLTKKFDGTGKDDALSLLRAFALDSKGTAPSDEEFNAFKNGTNNKAQLEADLANLDDDKKTFTNKFGNEELALLMSNLPAIDNLMKSSIVESTNYGRYKPEDLDLSRTRELLDREAAKAKATNQANVRRNATSSGQALSALSTGNAAISDSLMGKHLQTLAQEEAYNNQLGNEAGKINLGLANKEFEDNAANRAMADSIGNLALSDIGTNTQGYLKDKKMTAENIRQNKRLMSMINSFSPNYNWEDDNGEFAIQFVSALNKEK